MMNTVTIMINPTTMGGRIRAARLDAGLTQKELALRAKVTQPAIQQYESNKRGLKPDLSVLVRIAEACLVSLDYLLTGKDNGINVSNRLTDVSAWIPVLGWDQIDAWLEGIKMAANIERIPVFDKKSEKAFGLRVTDDAMSDNAASQSFTPNDVIFIDPAIPPLPGDFVVARIKNNYVFRRLIAQGSEKILKPLNSKYPEIHLDETYSLYRVVGVHRNF